jgi:hypothetical protein
VMIPVNPKIIYSPLKLGLQLWLGDAIESRERMLLIMSTDLRALPYTGTSTGFTIAYIRKIMYIDIVYSSLWLVAVPECPLIFVIDYM